jgi:hypothetical protein
VVAGNILTFIPTGPDWVCVSARWERDFVSELRFLNQANRSLFGFLADAHSGLSADLDIPGCVRDMSQVMGAWDG